MNHVGYHLGVKRHATVAARLLYARSLSPKREIAIVFVDCPIKPSDGWTDYGCPTRPGLSALQAGRRCFASSERACLCVDSTVRTHNTDFRTVDEQSHRLARLGCSSLWNRRQKKTQKQISFNHRTETRDLARCKGW